MNIYAFLGVKLTICWFYSIWRRFQISIKHGEDPDDCSIMVGDDGGGVFFSRVHNRPRYSSHCT